MDGNSSSSSLCALCVGLSLHAVPVARGCRVGAICASPCRATPRGVLRRTGRLTSVPLHLRVSSARAVARRYVSPPQSRVPRRVASAQAMLGPDRSRRDAAASPKTHACTAHYTQSPYDSSYCTPAASTTAAAHRLSPLPLPPTWRVARPVSSRRRSTTPLQLTAPSASSTRSAPQAPTHAPMPTRTPAPVSARTHTHAAAPLS